MKKMILSIMLILLVYVGFGQDAAVAATFDWTAFWASMKDIGIWTVVITAAIHVINYVMGIIPTNGKWSFLIRTLLKILEAWLKSIPDKRKQEKLQ